MKSYAIEHKPKREGVVIFPVVTELPDPIDIGETVYKIDRMFPGLYIYVGNKRWVTISSVKNNIIEEHTAEVDQKVFNLTTAYPTDGQSLNVYVDGRRLAKTEFIEIGENIVGIKEDKFFKGSERVEFQIFNKYEEREYYKSTRY